MILVNDTNEMVILKKPADGWLLPHIRQTYQNECLYELSHPSYLVKSELRDDVLITPYKGSHVREKLEEEPLLEQDQNLVCQLLEQWRSIAYWRERATYVNIGKQRDLQECFWALNISGGSIVNKNFLILTVLMIMYYNG